MLECVTAPPRPASPVVAHYSPGVMRRGTGLGAIAPMAPIETRPDTAKKKNSALQLASAKAMVGSSTPTTSSGPPRQPPFWISPTLVVRLKSIRVEKKASNVARVLARIRPEGNTTDSNSDRTSFFSCCLSTRWPSHRYPMDEASPRKVTTQPSHTTLE